LYSLGFFGVILQSVLTNNSKGILLTPLLVYVSTLELWKVKKRKSTQISFSIILLVILIPTFNFLQSNKLGKDSTFFANRFSEDLPKVLSPFLTLTNRFDQFARVTDAVSAEKGSMGSYSTWISYILKQIQWNPFSGRSQLSFGQQWNQLVTNQSIPGSRLNSVSLAQGMIAEGYVWRGFYSLLIECVIMGYLFSLLARFLDRGALSIIFAFGVVSNMSLFDAGIVSTAGLVSSSLKPTLFVYVFNVLILRGINRSIFRKSKN